MLTSYLKCVDALERRRLLSGGGEGGSGNIIFIEGTESADQIVVRSAAGGGGGADVLVNGEFTHIPPAQLANRFLVVQSRGGDDAVTVDAPVPTRMTVSGGAGEDALLINGTDGQDELDLLLGHSVITGTVVEHEEVERYRLNGGAATDGISVFATNPDMQITIDAQGGGDLVHLFTGFANDGFAGDAHLIGGAGDDHVLFDQQGSSVERTYALTPSRFSGAGPATFTYAEFERVRLRAGAGADLMRVTPSATATFTVEGGGFVPTAAPDTLELLPGGATGVTLVTTTPTSGRYAFADRMEVNFSGIESLPPPDTVFPRVSGAAFRFEGAPHALRVTFSESVVGSLDPGDLRVSDLTHGGTVAAASLLYDDASNSATFTFAGVLADAGYRATIAPADVTDASGNPLAAGLSFEFFFLNGDANRDARVNLEDFNILAANFGGADKTFGQGDFTYDGVVNLSDFNILAARFGRVLGADGGMYSSDERMPVLGLGTVGTTGSVFERPGGLGPEEDTFLDELSI